MMSKRILFFVLGVDAGGVSTAFKVLARELEAAGHHVDVMVGYEHEIAVSSIDRRHIIGYARRGRIRSGLLLRLVRLFNVVTRYRFYFLGMPRFAHDVFVVYNAYNVSHWVRYSRKKTFAWFHGMPQRKGRALNGRLWRWSTAMFLSKFDRLISVSDEVSDAWQSEYSICRPEVVQNIIDIDEIINLGRMELGDNTGRRLVYVGKVDENKGLMRLLCAIEELKGDLNLSNIKLTVVGDGPCRELCEHFVSERGIGHLVEFVGLQANPYPYMRSADLLVLPSREEGLGLVLWEALLNRTPVMATDAGGVRTALRNGAWGRIVQNEDDAITAGLREWLAGADYAPKCGYDEVERSLRRQDVETRQKIVELFG